MGMTITYNSDVLAKFETFFNNHKVDFIESITWLYNDESSFGASEEQGNLIVILAHFYFEIIKYHRQLSNPDWTYLNWLTQEEYDIIMNKREILGY